MTARRPLYEAGPPGTASTAASGIPARAERGSTRCPKAPARCFSGVSSTNPRNSNASPRQSSASRPLPLQGKISNGLRDATSLPSEPDQAATGFASASAFTAVATVWHCCAVSSGNIGSDMVSSAARSECGNCPAW